MYTLCIRVVLLLCFQSLEPTPTNATDSNETWLINKIETTNKVKTMSIIKSNSDNREYRYLKLPNEIQVLLISDPEADKSAASLDVNVGCALDPKPLYGTAHFLEHMLFMGSEKYPSENEYAEYVKNNGGYSNAFTSLTDTNYHFENLFPILILFDPTDQRISRARRQKENLPTTKVKEMHLLSLLQ